MPLDLSQFKKPKLDFSAFKSPKGTGGTVLEEEHPLAAPYRKELKAAHPDTAVRFLQDKLGLQVRGEHGDYEFKLPHEKEWRVLDPSDPEWKDLYDWAGDFISILGAGWGAVKGAVAGAATTGPLAPLGALGGGIFGGALGGAGAETAKQAWLKARGLDPTLGEAASKVGEETIYGGMAEPVGRYVVAPVGRALAAGLKRVPKALQAPVQFVGKAKEKYRGWKHKELEVKTPPTPWEDPTRVPPEATMPSPGTAKPPPRPKSSVVEDGLPESPPAPPVDMPMPEPQEGAQTAMNFVKMAHSYMEDASQKIYAVNRDVIAKNSQAYAAMVSKEIPWETGRVLIDNNWKRYFTFRDKYWKEALEDTMVAGEKMGLSRKEAERMAFERGMSKEAPRVPDEGVKPGPGLETPPEAQKPLTEAPVTPEEASDEWAKDWARPGGPAEDDIGWETYKRARAKGTSQKMAGGRPRGERGPSQEMPGWKQRGGVRQAVSSENVSQTAQEAIEKGFYRPKPPKPPTPTSRGILPEAAEMPAAAKPAGWMERFWEPRHTPHSIYRSMGTPPWLIAGAGLATYPQALAGAVGTWVSWHAGRLLETKGMPWIMKVLEKKASPKLMERARMLLGYMTARGYMTAKEAIRALSNDPEFQQVMEGEV